MNKQEILAKIKSLVTMNFSTEPVEKPEVKPEVKPEPVVTEFEEDEVVYELSYEGELVVGLVVSVKAGEETLETFTGEIQEGNYTITIVENIVTEIAEVVEEEEESEDESDTFTSEFSEEVISKFSAINETLEEVINKFKTSETENEALRAEITKLNEEVSKFSKQEVDKREPKTYMSREEFLRNPRIVNDLK